MSKIEQNKERKRQAILQSAQQVFLSEGYVQASMDKIAKQAQMTKQTLYRYFPSKVELFQATLLEMGRNVDEGFLTQLQNPNTKEALVGFASEFISHHLSGEHIATFRLLVAEGAKAPEIVSSFMSVGPDNTEEKLTAFFKERLNIEDSIAATRLWTGMLLSMRSGVLIGQNHPTEGEIKQHAIDATEFLLAGFGH